MIQKYLHALLVFCCFGNLSAQQLYFPPLSGDQWETVAPESVGWCADGIDQLFNFLEDKNTKAFILLKDGKIVIEKYFGTFKRDSVWYWASAGKTLTAFTVGLAQEDGFLSLTDKTSKYLGDGWTDCPPEKENLITIWNQLTMTSGLNDRVDDPYCTDTECLTYLADAGTRWAYHNAPYTLLDQVVEGATGKNLNGYFVQRISNQTGITGLFVKVGDNNVFFSKPRNMARFGLLMLNRGNWNGVQIMKDTAFFNQMVNTSQDINLSYGYLWWLNGKPSYMVPGLQVMIPGYLAPNAPEDMIAALGKNGQIINIVPSQNLVFIRMGDAPGAGEVPFTLGDDIWSYLNAARCSTTSLFTAQEPAFDFQCFPNPSRDQFSIKGIAEKYEVTLYDTSGKRVLFQKDLFGETTVHTQDLAEGLYIVTVRTPKGQYSVKWIKEQ